MNTPVIDVSEYIRQYPNCFCQEDSNQITEFIYHRVLSELVPDENAVNLCKDGYLKKLAEFTESVLAEAQQQDSTQRFTIELECLEMNDISNFVIFGGPKKSHRFMVGMIAINNVDAELNFASSENTINFKAGDLIIFGPYFSNRFTFVERNNKPLKIINLYSSNVPVLQKQSTEGGL